MTRYEHFTPFAFDFLWESMRVGELPYPVCVPTHGQTVEERVFLRHRALTELRARGLRDQYGQLVPHVREWLEVLANPTMSVDALHIPDYQTSPVGILAASDGRRGVLLLQDSTGIRMSSIVSEGLVSTVVALLPAGRRGVEASITLPLEVARRTPAQAPKSDGESTSLSERAADPREAYARLSGQPRLRGGQLAANSRDRLGSRRRSPVLGWFDTATGRYLSLSRSGSDSREWVTVSPADARTLRTRLAEMLGTVTANIPQPGF